MSKAGVVVASGDPTRRADVAGALRALGFATWEAAEDRQALALVAQETPRALVADVWSAGVSGFDLLDHLRASGATPGLGVILLIDGPDSDARLEGFGEGAAACLPRDMPAAALASRIAAVLGPIGEAGA